METTPLVTTAAPASTGFSGMSLFIFFIIFLILLIIIAVNIFFANRIFNLANIPPNSTIATINATTAKTIADDANIIFWVNVVLLVILFLIIIIALIYYFASSSTPTTVTVARPSVAMPAIPTTPVSIQRTENVNVPISVPISPTSSPVPSGLTTVSAVPTYVPPGAASPLRRRQVSVAPTTQYVPATQYVTDANGQVYEVSG